MPAFSRMPDTNPNQVVTRQQVLEQLERTLAHPLFQGSLRLSAFLRYAVDRTLAGEASGLKEYVIGVEVFARGSSFDPQVDNVVRVSANRLRSKLAEYYHGAGHADPVVIDIPRGGYVAVFSPAHAAEAGPQNPRIVRSNVGRGHELERIRAALASACLGTGFMVTVSGEPGMGKTTLVEEFLAEIESSQQPAWIARGRCSERLSKADALAPILDCLDELTRGRSGAEAEALMRQEAPAWHTQIGLGHEDPTGSAKDISHERMRRELLHFVEALSARRPVILFLDDVHWADASTCDLLSYLGSLATDGHSQVGRFVSDQRYRVLWCLHGLDELQPGYREPFRHSDPP